MNVSFQGKGHSSGLNHAEILPDASAKNESCSGCCIDAGDIPSISSIDVVIQDTLADAQSHTENHTTETSTSIDEVFFEFANVKTLGYRCQDGSLLGNGLHRDYIHLFSACGTASIF